MSERSPRGALGAGVLKILSANAALTNGEIRKKMRATGYSWPLDPMLMNKMLRTLIKKGQVKKSVNGQRHEYSKA